MKKGNEKMKNWRRIFLKQMELELSHYRVDSIFLEEDGQNPDTLRQMFDVGNKEVGILLVVMDIAIFVMEDGKQLLQIYTEMVLDAQESPELLKQINEINFSIPLGNFGYFKQEKQLYHKYNQIVKEPTDVESFVKENMENIDVILGSVMIFYKELYTLAQVK